MDHIFVNIENLTREEGQQKFLEPLFLNSNSENGILTDNEMPLNVYKLQVLFLRNIIKEIDDLITVIKNNDNILISVKNQKLLQKCYQIIVSLGISQCLLPGLGIKLSKRCLSANKLISVDFSDIQKYDMLVECTEFLSRSYDIPVLKKIIITLHLSDYLAALIQLCFAPLKKPGIYTDFTMTLEMYERFTKDRVKYKGIYEYLVINCFQPTLMKELLVLQSVNDPSPPMFVKRAITKELSRRLLAPGGLLSLIRCFMDSYNTDTGHDWKKIEMICKIVTTKHGNDTETAYLNIICSQIAQLLSLNNTHYLSTAIACILSLNVKYSHMEPVKSLMKNIFQAFDYDCLISSSNLPGTIVVTTQEIEQKVNILNTCSNITNLDCSYSLLLPNLYLLFILGVKSTKNEGMQLKLKDILLKCLCQLQKQEIAILIKDILFGKDYSRHSLQVEEYVSGLIIKYVSSPVTYSKEEALAYFLSLLQSSTETQFIEYTFDTSLEMLIEFNEQRNSLKSNETLLAGDNLVLFNNFDEQYIIILQLLSELSASPKIISILKHNPSSVINFIEYYILKQKNCDDECLTLALVLLNTILSNSKNINEIEKHFIKLIPVLKSMSKDDNSMVSLLCKEALNFITSGHVQVETKYVKALADAFDNLLPVRAHGLIELTKLIETKDTETLSKKHYVFCLFQEQLKDPDSYIYLAAINGIAALGTHCTDDVLHVLCKEFLQVTSDLGDIHTVDGENKVSQLRMKIGDVIVKVTKKLGEMAIVHKTILLNTMLCGCRDEDPLIRASALSNLAEICLVLHYKMGTIIYEVLHCVWSILETDKAIECRRAAVLIISSLIKGLGKKVLIQLKENLLPIYRGLKKIYNDNNEDSVLRLHSQVALEELNDTVNQFVFPEVKLEKQIFVLDKPNEIFK
ncbi:unnamed protein product [Diatraea saccharalis]|uniref:Transmembrane and coiled-coil domain-containing protein 7 n=1 Tax=Diatraea saccharalis TaxID=40085 RepID=A0A9N9QVN0_9NEOP|nr:unnamed protein product [Diatraea saccharalis]